MLCPASGVVCHRGLNTSNASYSIGTVQDMASHHTAGQPACFASRLAPNVTDSLLSPSSVAHTTSRSGPPWCVVRRAWCVVRNSLVCGSMLPQIPLLKWVIIAITVHDANKFGLLSRLWSFNNFPYCTSVSHLQQLVGRNPGLLGALVQCLEEHIRGLQRPSCLLEIVVVGDLHPDQLPHSVGARDEVVHLRVTKHEPQHWLHHVTYNNTLSCEGEYSTTSVHD
jgi:hypothetical protein